MAVLTCPSAFRPAKDAPVSSLRIVAKPRRPAYSVLNATPFGFERRFDDALDELREVGRLTTVREYPTARRVAALRVPQCERDSHRRDE